MLRFTAFVSFPLLFGLSLVAPQIIVIAITDKWIESAYMLRVLALWGAFMPVQSMFTNLLISRGCSLVYMWGTVIQGIIVLLLLVAMASWGIQAMMFAYVLFNILWLFVWRHYAGIEIGLSIPMFLRDMFPYALLSAAIMMFTGYITASIENIYLLLLSRIAVAATLYIVTLLLMRNDELSEVVEFLTHRKRKE